MSLKEGLTPLSSLSALLGLARGKGQSGAHTALILSGEGRQVALIVDELGEEREVTTRAVLESVLEEAHYDVNTAQDGEQAFTLLQQRPFDLVLRDVQMPHEDGFSSTENVRQHERFTQLPVVLMTSLESETDSLRGLRAGASAYLTKSGFDHQTLLETVAALL